MLTPRDVQFPIFLCEIRNKNSCFFLVIPENRNFPVSQEFFQKLRKKSLLCMRSIFEFLKIELCHFNTNKNMDNILKKLSNYFLHYLFLCNKFFYDNKTFIFSFILFYNHFLKNTVIHFYIYIFFFTSFEVYFSIAI